MVKVHLLESGDYAIIALGISFIAFLGVLVNVLCANHSRAKIRWCDRRRDCCHEINYGIQAAIKAGNREETFAAEIQILSGLIDLKRTQETR